VTGVIKTYLSQKQYGFIKGDDGKDYFFHQSGFKDKSKVNKICGDLVVIFEQKATPKGYSAVKIDIENISDEHIKYIVPDTIYTSREYNIKGWDIIDLSKQTIYGSSRNSPDFAKDELKKNARYYGANAVINMQYFKTTGSEMGSSFNIFSTHHYTIHNFKGQLVNIGKRSAQGTHKKSEFINIDDYATNIESVDKSENTKFIVWSVSIILILSTVSTLFK